MSSTKALNNLRHAAERERDEIAGQLERIGAGLWQILATAIVAADANPGELTLASRRQTASGMYAVWCAVVDGGDDRG